MESPDASATLPTQMPTLLLCALCDKPFTNERQYKRHMAYCRKSQGRKRLRSCRACNQSKIKCNSCAPCHQCIRKGVKCTFDQQQPRQRQNGSSRMDSETAVAAVVPNTVPVNAAVPSVDLDLTLADLGAEGLDLSLENDDLLALTEQIEVDGFGALPYMSHMSQMQYSSSKDGPDWADRMISNSAFCGNSLSTTTTMVAGTTPAGEDSFMTLLNKSLSNNATSTSFSDIDFQLDDNSYYYSGKELQQPTFSPVLPPSTIATPTTDTSPPTEMVTSRHFAKNSVKAGIQQTCATMIIDMVCAYPRMMTRRETLPPFMHTYSFANDADDNQNKLPEQLTNCMGIAQLFAVRSNDTHSFVWATIQAEMRGFKTHLNTFNKYDALSALQASLLYVIIRGVDDVPHKAKDDIEMLLTYEDVCGRAMELALNGSHQTEDKVPNIRWKDWIYMESIRRIACVKFILGLVFHIRTGKPCFISEHYREILLPCTKAEWEAKTELQWRKEHDNAAARSTAVLHTFGDLIDAHRCLSGAREASDKLGMWNATIDHLGMVLNLAVHAV